MKRKMILPTVAAILVILIFGAAVFGGTLAWLSKNRQAQSNMNMKLQATALQLEGLHVYKRGADGFYWVKPENQNDPYKMDDFDSWDADGKYELYIAVKLDKIPENVTSLNVTFQRDPSVVGTSTLTSLAYLPGLANDAALSFDTEPTDLTARTQYLDSLTGFRGAQADETESTIGDQNKITFTNIQGEANLADPNTTKIFLFRLDYIELTEPDNIDMFTPDENIDTTDMTYHAPYLNDFTNIIFEIPENK